MRIILAAVFVLTGFLALGQNYPTRQIGKESFYVYTVEEGNTVYGISRQFAVKVSDILGANADLDQGLKVGQEVFVPLQAVDKKELKSNDVKLEGNYLLHLVQPKETLFSISKRYGVSIDFINEANPELQSGLKAGMSLRIATSSSTATDDAYVKPASIGNQKLHRVAAGETLYSLAKMYDLSPSQIQEANNMTSTDLQVGYWIRIPERPVVALKNQEDEPAVGIRKSSKNSYDIVYVLPFHLRGNDSLSASLFNGDELHVLTEIALDFYRGSLLAIDSLKKLGFNANVHFFDVAEDVVDARSVLKRSEIGRADLIIGPFHKNNFAAFAEKALKDETYIISPNSFSNEVFADNPYLIRAQASRETLMRYLANYVAIQHQNDNVLMVNNTLSQDAMYRKLFRSSYNEALGSFPNALSDSIKFLTKSQITEDGLRAALRRDVPNVLVVPSNELAFVSDLITKLSRINTDYRIQLYGLDTWLKYDNIDAEYKDKFKLRLVVASYVDYAKPEVNAFLKLYREAYKMDPTIYGYGFQGFDLTLFFGKALMNYGMDFPYNLSSLEGTGLFSNYRIGKSTTGKELENKAAYIIEYSDYSIKQIN